MKLSYLLAALAIMSNSALAAEIDLTNEAKIIKNSSTLAKFLDVDYWKPTGETGGFGSGVEKGRANSYELKNLNVQSITANSETGRIKVVLRPEYLDSRDIGDVNPQYWNGRDARISKAPAPQTVERFFYVQDGTLRAYTDSRFPADPVKALGKPNFRDEAQVAKLSQMLGDYEGVFKKKLMSVPKLAEGLAAPAGKMASKLKGRAGKAGIVGAAAIAATMGYEAVAGDTAQAAKLNALDNGAKEEAEPSEVSIGTLD